MLQFPPIAILLSPSHVSLAQITGTELNLPPQIPKFIVLALLGTGWFVPGLGGALLNPIERLGKRLAKRKSLAIFALAAAPVVVRLALLWTIPIPFPHVHDEFSYLLMADTFVHGRLTNPPHPMAFYLDTFNINQYPTYMSIFPPAQGAFLAVGQLLGHPWIGVVLSVAAMCAAVVWMLQGWLPPQWALVGGALFVLRFGIFSDWMNSYWGAAPAVLGGALVVGALPRILRSWYVRDAVILGLGASVLALSRPLEGFFVCMSAFVYLVVRMAGRRSPSLSYTLSRIALPVILMGICGAIFTGYYNWRGTGNALLSPYILFLQNHLTISQIAWVHSRPPIHFQIPQFEALYNDWWKNTAWQEGYPDSLRNFLAILGTDAKRFGNFYLWPELYVPLVTIFWVLKDRRVRFLLILVAVSFAAFPLVTWFQPRYAAPCAASVFGLLTQGLRHLRRWRWNGRPVGVGLTRAVVLSAVIFAPLHGSPVSGDDPQARVIAQLEAMPGDHLVVVHYSAEHNPHRDWVFNRADIDHAKIVWAREIPGVPLQPLLDYFHGRKIWLVEPDAANPTLSPYPGASQPN